MMDSTASVAVAAVVVGLAIWIWRQSRPRHFPPGPLCLPVFGSVLSMKAAPFHLQLDALREKYGNIFSFTLGSSHCIVLNRYNVVKEALVKQAVEFASKAGPENIRMHHFTTNYPTLGIGDGKYSDEWKHQRSCAMRILRSLGYGTSKLEAHIRAEASALRRALAATKGGPTNPSSLFRTSTVNVICSVLYGQRYENGDKEFKALEKIIYDTAYGFFADIDCDYIWLLSFKPSYKKMLRDLYAAYNAMNTLNGAKIRERHERLEKNGYSEPNDFIEHYLCEVRKEQASRKMRENWLSGIVNEFFLGGADSMSNILDWACLWLASRPDIQDKVYEEVRMAMGSDTSEIPLSVRDQCPYLEATLMEVMRISPGEPVAARVAANDIKFHGYTIPKDTKIFVNIYSVLMDPEIWTAPDQFVPERHIDEGRVVHGPGWVPFTMGRRSCMGEQLSRQELFLLFAPIVSSFKIRLPEGQQINLAPWDQGLMKPHPYEVIFEPRE